MVNPNSFGWLQPTADKNRGVGPFYASCPCGVTLKKRFPGDSPGRFLER